MSSLLSNPAVSNLGASLVVMQVARKIDFEDQQVFTAVRAGYLFTQLLCLVAYYYCSYKIKSKNELKTIKYTEPKNPLSPDTSGGQVTTTIREYDLAQVSQGIRGVFMGMAFMAFMHLYMGYTQPLFVQSILPLKSLYENKEVKIHVLGKPAVGDLKRPFAAQAGFMQQAAERGADAVEDKKSK